VVVSHANTDPVVAGAVVVSSTVVSEVARSPSPL